jgi:hypothetical protein
MDLRESSQELGRERWLGDADAGDAILCGGFFSALFAVKAAKGLLGLKDMFEKEYINASFSIKGNVLDVVFICACTNFDWLPLPGGATPYVNVPGIFLYCEGTMLMSASIIQFTES